MDKGGINSGSDSHGVLDGVQTDGPGFSLCAAPLESLGPVFQDERVTGGTSGGPGYTGLELAEKVTVRRGVEWMILIAVVIMGQDLGG